MELIKKAFITNCILMGVCAVLLGYTVATFSVTYELLHSGDLSSLIAILLIPVFFLASLATAIMGIIQVSIATRNIVKVRKWYTILLLVISILIVVTPVVLVLLLFLL